MVTTVQGATGTWGVTAEGPRLGAIKTRCPRWKHTEVGHPGDDPNLPVLGSQDGTLHLRMTLKRTPELGSPIHSPEWKKRTWGACLHLTLTWRVSWAEQKRETTPSRPHHLSPPLIIVLSGSSGVQSSLTPQHAGENSPSSLARVMSRSLWGGSGHHSSYPRWAAAPEEWPTTTLCCWHPSPWTKISSCCCRTWGLAAGTIGWHSHKRPWLTPRCSSIGWKKPSLTPGKTCQLVENMPELWWATEPLTSFIDAEVLETSWVKITSAQTSEPVDPPTSQKWSHSRSCRAQASGAFVAAHGIGQLKPTATV